MSRHRYVRNMNLQEEMDDDALSDGGDDMTPEQQEQMEKALDHVRQIIGDEATSGFSDNVIRDVLWDEYFDVEKTLDWCFEEQRRKKAANERKVLNRQKSLPALPPDEQLAFVENRIPKIVLAQQQQQLEEDRQSSTFPALFTDVYNDKNDASASWRSRLSPITERTERSLESSTRPPTTTNFSSYGNTLEEGRLGQFRLLDPNFIPASPSPSALQRLSNYDPVSSKQRSASSASTAEPSSPPTNELAPDVTESAHSQSGHNTSAQHSQSEPKSKLSQLASFRTTTATKSNVSGDISSHAYGTVVTGSIRTFPTLRPAPQSMAGPSASVRSSTSFHIHHAVDIALAGEREDAQAVSPPSEPPSLPSSFPPTLPSKGSKAPSKLAQLAQAKASNRTTVSMDAKNSPELTSPRASARAEDNVATSTQPSAAAASTHASSASMPWENSKPLTSPRQAASPPAAESAQVKCPSKLALLAHAKAASSKTTKAPSFMTAKASRKPPVLPSEHTKLLTPVANGSSVTTAITTSYQSLYSLTSPNARPDTELEHYVVPLPEMGGTVSTRLSQDKHPSKLSAKIKEAQQKQNAGTAQAEEEKPLPIPPPAFVSKDAKSRASPSAFAMLLVEAHPHSQDIKRSRTTTGHGDNAKSTTTRRHHSTRAPPISASPTNFKFDKPSPDDIVLNARRKANKSFAAAGPSSHA